MAVESVKIVNNSNSNNNSNNSGGGYLVLEKCSVEDESLLLKLDGTTEFGRVSRTACHHN